MLQVWLNFSGKRGKSQNWEPVEKIQRIVMEDNLVIEQQLAYEHKMSRQSLHFILTNDVCM